MSDFWKGWFVCMVTMLITQFVIAWLEYRHKCRKEEEWDNYLEREALKRVENSKPPDG